MAAEEVVRRFASDAERGLSAEAAALRLAEHGANEIEAEAGKSAWRIWWAQLSATMVVVLLVAGLISLALRDFKDAAAIFAIVALNALFGFAQEYRAEKAMAALRRLAAPSVRVRRGGHVVEMAARDLVPGDLLVLEAGNFVGADCRLLEAATLRIDEAALTGESAPVEKASAPLASEAVPLAERINMAWLGTMVTSGRGCAVVTETGMRTELGRIAGMLERVGQEQTPLQRRLDELGRSLALVALVLVAVIFVLGLMRGEDPTLMFLTGVSMAVAAIPEGLPAVVTIALALGAQRMLKRRALIRNLPAAETLGSVTAICSDKTGTLTENRMTVTALYTGCENMRIGREWDDAVLAGQRPEFTLLLAAAALCNDAQIEGAGEERHALGDPTEAALAIAASRAGLRKPELETALPRVAELPFESARKRMTSVHRTAQCGETLPPGLRRLWPAEWHRHPFLAFTKGALESVLQVCAQQWRDGAAEVLTTAERQRIIAAGDDFAQAGQRVLGIAFRPLATTNNPADFERDLIFLGMAAISDPPRAEVRTAVEMCQAAGIRALMITGDHPLTARHVAHELGIGGRVLTGGEIEAMSPEELHALVEKVSIYARVLPEHKFRIVEALQNRGHIVSMTGDGVNDAPALKRANIGVAMGITGTDVSKQASDMVLLDDNFTTIVAAVEEGRAIYDNIRKFIRYVLAGNVGEILVMLLGPFFGMPLPLLPLQILWINLATDGLNGLALSVEPPERDAMRRPPYPPGEGILGRGIGAHILRVGAIVGLVPLAIGLLWWRRHDPAWQTMVFATLTFTQVFQTLAVRSWRESLFSIGLWSNKTAAASVTVSGALTLAIIYVPWLQRVFGTVPLTARELLFALLFSSAVFWSIEIEKWWQRRGCRHTAA